MLYLGNRILQDQLERLKLKSSKKEKDLNHEGIEIVWKLE